MERTIKALRPSGGMSYEFRLKKAPDLSLVSLIFRSRGAGI
jgi:hypothetical protein